VPRRDEQLRREGYEIQPERDAAAHGLALVHRNAIPLVDGQQQRPAPLQHQAQHGCVLLRDSLVGIQHHHHHMRRLQVWLRWQARPRDPRGDTPAVSISVNLRPSLEGKIESRVVPAMSTITPRLWAGSPA
jgi:hypothetical protein